jgi:sugar O-acyltransferase (sialic acid O-acetyltransferase NeuD family)
MAKELYIIGAGGFGREVADTVREINRAEASADGPVYHIAGFADDDESLWGTVINDIEVRGGVEWLRGLENTGDKPCAVITVADPKMRECMVKMLDGRVTWVNLIHPLAFVSDTATIGSGNIIQQFTTVNSNVRVGDHCIVNCNSVIGHDAIVEDFVSVMPQCGLMGYCTMKKRAYIGAGAVMIQNVVVGEDAVVGAGAVVIKDVAAGATVVGNPVRPVKY